MATRLETAISASVSLNIPLKADGNIQQDGDTAATQKSYTMNFWNGQAIIWQLNQDASILYSRINDFCTEFWTDILGVSYDEYSIKSKIELNTIDS